MRETTTFERESNRPGSRTAAVAGAILAVLGALAVIAPFGTGRSLSVLLGVVLVAGAIILAAGAIAHVLHALSVATLRETVGQRTLAVRYAVTGTVCTANAVAHRPAESRMKSPLSTVRPDRLTEDPRP